MRVRYVRRCALAPLRAPARERSRTLAPLRAATAVCATEDKSVCRRPQPRARRRAGRRACVRVRVRVRVCVLACVCARASV